MKVIALNLLFAFAISSTALAAIVKGKVTEQNGAPLPFASIYIKGSTKGTTTNIDGHYQFEISEGKHILVCHYVGFRKEEIEITIPEGTTTKNFILKNNENALKEVVITQGDNPALAIIKKTIKKRAFYNKQIDAYTAEAYIKGNIKLDDISKNNMLVNMIGKSEKDTGQTSEEFLNDQKGIIFLSESVSEIAYKRPDKLKTIVKSSRVSGQNQSYGFDEPLFINMYDNNIAISEQLSPRGFVSPIAETALLNYKYELLSAYMEGNKLINRIRVIPRRKFEPLFSGIIDIIEGEWRLHTVDLLVDKEHQLDVIDTLFIKQIFVPVQNVLMVKDQSFKVKLKIFGFGFTGHFVQTFSDYSFDYEPTKYFNKFVKEYNADALNKTAGYWDTIRPIPLDEDEQRDYIKKDSIEKVNELKKDSLPVQKNSFRSIVLRGFGKSLNKKERFSTDPIIAINNFNWNTAEGLNYSFGLRYRNAITKDKTLSTTLKMRYGVSNAQFNARLNIRYAFGKTNKSTLALSGGRYVFQYNNEEPVDPLINSLYTLFYARNYLKIYQAPFINAKFDYRHVSGFQIHTSINYQDRNPLANTNLFTFRKNNQLFTANYPVEKISSYETRHQAFIGRIGLSYQPGRKYIKYPDRIVSSASKYPTFGFNFTLGLPVLGSDIDYSKWEITVTDYMKLNLWGTFSYKIKAGGFLGKNVVSIVDYTHFNGNQIILAAPYLNSFQLSSYYANSNTESLYTTLNAEHHFYGLLTNKIPLFRRLKWYLVAASNMYYVNQNNNYIEASLGLENIGFKMIRFMRVDGVAGYSNFKSPVYGIRIGINSTLFGIGIQNED